MKEKNASIARAAIAILMVAILFSAMAIGSKELGLLAIMLFFALIGVSSLDTYEEERVVSQSALAREWAIEQVEEEDIKILVAQDIAQFEAELMFWRSEIEQKEIATVSKQLLAELL